jgi:ubiquinone/menaquinone biosynthesis C-methylase UbiE
VFHWVLDKKASLREIFRVLKSGGKVGITTSAKELSKVSETRKITDSVLKRDHFKDFVELEKSTQNQHGLTTTELITLLAEADFKVTDIQVLLHERKHAKAKDIIAFSEASSFGNYLNHVPDSLRDRAKQEIITEFEKLRTSDGITVDGYRTFAVAKKV